MAITRIQQLQISGSLSYNDGLTNLKPVNATLADDLNALRTQIKAVIGKSGWDSALDGSQDLADIYQAVHMTGTAADFQGKLDVTGVADFDAAVYMAQALGVSGSVAFLGSATMGSSLTVAGTTNLNGNVVLGDASSDSITFTAKAGSSLDMNSSNKVTNLAQASTSGDALAWGKDASVSDLIVTAGDFKVDAGGTVSAAGALYVAGATGLSGSLTVAGASTMNGSLTVAGAANLNGNVVLGDASSDSITFTAKAGSSLDMNSSYKVTNLAQASTSGDALAWGKDASVSDLIVTAGDFKVDAGGTVSAAGALYVAGATGLSGSLTVAGGVNLNGNVTLGDASSDTITFTAKAASSLDMNSSYKITNLAQASSTGDALAWGKDASVSDLIVTAGDFTVDASGNVSAAGTLGVTGLTTLGGGLTVNSAVADFNAGITADSIKIDGDTATRLYIVGSDGAIKDEANLTFASNQLKVQGDLWVTGSAQIDGDLYVKGAMTYIETTNMKVKDAFIYLATGSTGTSDAGIVFSKGAGNSHDLVIGQDGGAGEVIFAKVAYNSANDTIADLNGASLVPAWMSEVKLGGSEGTQTAGVAMNGADLEVKAYAGAALKLVAFGDETFSLAADGEQATFDANFTATTIIGAINELYTSVTATDNAKGTLTLANVNGSRELNFSSIGSLVTPDHKNVDVFLNGVLLAPGYDLESSVGSSKVTLKSDLYSQLNNDDVFTVVLRAI